MTIPDYLFEIKWDGFRTFARVEHCRCKLVSRNGNEFKSFSALNEAVAAHFEDRFAILDAEIVSLSNDG